MSAETVAAALGGDDLAERAGAVLEGVTPLAGWLRNPWSKSDVERGPIPEWLAALLFEAAIKIEASADLITALLARIAALTVERDACSIYLKDGETPRQRMDRDHADVLALMQMLAKEKARAEAAEAEVARLRGALADMIAVAEQDEWDKAMTGRQIILRNARAALTQKEPTNGE